MSVKESVLNAVFQLQFGWQMLKIFEASIEDTFLNIICKLSSNFFHVWLIVIAKNNDVIQPWISLRKQLTHN